MSSGTDKIISRIMSEAQEKADKIIQDAQSEVDLINNNATKDAEAEKNKILENGKKQSDMRYQQIISEAKMNVRRAELEAKEEVIESAFNKAIEDLTRVASSDNAEYMESLTDMIKEAAYEIGGGDLIVSVKEGDVGKINNNLTTIATDITNSTGIRTTLSLGENIDAIGGTILKTVNGNIEVDNTIESRLERFKKVLRSEVAGVLFNF